jgi:hypothetical protein
MAVYPNNTLKAFFHELLDDTVMRYDDFGKRFIEKVLKDKESLVTKCIEYERMIQTDRQGRKQQRNEMKAIDWDEWLDELRKYYL